MYYSYDSKLAAEIREFLNGLGEDADSIAQRVRQAGIKGLRASALECPIGVLLRRQFMATVTVGSIPRYYATFTTFKGEPVSGYGHDVAMPRAVAEFLGAFNRGEYPDLLRNF